ncbi:MAG TPA: hypothetical protein VN441_02365 [Syntrophomonas sp.]|nr:hypothetical protein [Syntrophomonas sp.]
MNRFMKANKKIEKAVVSGYQAIENGVVSGYKKIEDGVVGGYKKIEKKFVDAFLTPDDPAENNADSDLHNDAQKKAGAEPESQDDAKE